jgi:hypothetical protein
MDFFKIMKIYGLNRFDKNEHTNVLKVSINQISLLKLDCKILLK